MENWENVSSGYPDECGQYVVLINYKNERVFPRIVDFVITDDGNKFFDVDIFTKTYCTITHYVKIPKY